MALLVGTTAAAATPVADLLERHGVRPIDPPVPAPGFRLPLLAGGEGSLADHRGRWVVLTFFATWCAPCRSEMPTLEALHRQRGADGLDVVTVSEDRSRRPLDPFVEELELSLPVYWDRDGAVGAAYRAESIPVSYLVDPYGHLVGLSRGARDWNRLVPLVDALLAAVPPDAAAEASYAPLAPLELAAADPPTADWSLPEPSPRPGRPFPLEVTLRWSGRLDEYLPQPPRLELPAGIDLRSVTAASSSGDGGHTVRYRLELEAAAAGRYALDPIELRYQPALASEPAMARIDGPTVEVAAPSMGGAPAVWLAAAASVAAATAAWVVAARRRAGAAGDGPGDEPIRLAEELAAARSERLAGRPERAFEMLARLAARLDPDGSGAPAAERLEAVRFGGRRPGAGELEHLEQQVERRLAALEPDPERAARQRLKLRPDPSAPETDPETEERA